jgi:uncharacterized protein YjiS (DUF1127 family)
MLRPGLRIGLEHRTNGMVVFLAGASLGPTRLSRVRLWEIAMFLSVLLERLQSAISRRRALRELSVLSDRELWDVGIVRSDFRSTVGNAFD